MSRDVSTGGIRFEAVGIEINLGDLLRVTFNVGRRTIVATGKVVWAVETDPITQEVGIAFHEIDPSCPALARRGDRARPRIARALLTPVFCA